MLNLTTLNSTAMEHFHCHRKVFLLRGLARVFNRLRLKFVLFIEKELGLSEKKMKVLLSYLHQFPFECHILEQDVASEFTWR